MNNINSIQLKELFSFLISGLMISFLFDIFRAKRRTIKTSVIITNIEDIIYWIISGYIIISTIIKYTYGEIRSFMIIGLVLGVVAYFFFISKFIVMILVKLFNIILFPFKKINKLIKKY